MNQEVLAVENVSKKFCRSLKRSLWYGVKDLVNETLFRNERRAELRKGEFWALRNVSFELHRGEIFGIIGHNGAGKSTLLKLISGLFKPDTGSIRVRGRVGALIELGMGFNPILTGRENIYANAAILGMGRKEVNRRLQRIIDFAEIDEFLDTPVQSYSSGMKARLGFAIAAHLDPDLFLIDEVLSVGDASFRQRCVDRLADYRRKGGTIIFVSHNSTVIEKICDRVMLLDHGRTNRIGEPSTIVRDYEAQALALNRQADVRLGCHSTSPAGDIRITTLACYDLAGHQRGEFQLGEPFEVRLQYEFDRDLHFPYFEIMIANAENPSWATSYLNMMWDDIRLAHPPRRGVMSCMIHDPAFPPGLYRLAVGIQSQPAVQLGEKWYLPRIELGSLVILPGDLENRLPGLPKVYVINYPSSMIVEHSWRLNDEDLSNHPAPVRNIKPVRGL